MRVSKAWRRGGYTLIEILIATALALILMAGVVRLFSAVGSSVADSRSVLEAWDRQRAASLRLQKDLEGVTVTMFPPRRPEASEGYFEIIEGPNRAENNIAIDSATGKADTTVGDFDDILMFTTRTTGKPFAGRCDSAPGKIIESDFAEVAWFVRNRTLYRRVMLIASGATIQSAGSPFAANDISVRQVDGAWVANNLSDLTKRECRYAHDTRAFPFDARGWGYWGLPTLGDCSAVWPKPVISRSLTPPDFWTMKPTEPIVGPAPWNTGDGPRAGEDVILTNVIGFDVKVFDPSPLVGTYVDLGFNPAAGTSFSGLEHPKSGLCDPDKPPPPARVYDTWSLHYEHDGIRQPTARWNPVIDALPGVVDAGTNGFDDDNNLGVDDMGEWETMPPYPAALRGVQVKIRVFEPSSRHIREVTVVQDFLPK